MLIFKEFQTIKCFYMFKNIEEFKHFKEWNFKFFKLIPSRECILCSLALRLMLTNLSPAFGSAPACSNNLQMLRLPFTAATIKGVQPNSCLTLISTALLFIKLQVTSC